MHLFYKILLFFVSENQIQNLIYLFSFSWLIGVSIRTRVPKPGFFSFIVIYSCWQILWQ